MEIKKMQKELKSKKFKNEILDMAIRLQADTNLETEKELNLVLNKDISKDDKRNEMIAKLARISNEFSVKLIEEVFSLYIEKYENEN